MGALKVAHPTNGTNPFPAARVIPLSGAKVDRLLALRADLKRLQEEERNLTAELVRILQAQGLKALQGSRAVAVLDERTTLKADPELFCQALGQAAWGALTVSVTAARRLLGEDDLRAISETGVQPVLRVEPLDAPAVPTRAA